VTWQTVPFDQAFSDITAKSPRVKQSEFGVTGKYPVRDQGERDIAGFWDNASDVTRVDRPLILFGDHTRRVKFASEDFVIGADGVKVLAISRDLEPRFAFHWMSALKIPSAGYSRHFKFLREYRVPVPPRPEQRRVAAILDEADSASRLRDQQLERIDELRRARIDSISPDLVEFRELGELIDPARPLTYGILMPGPEVEGGVPYIRVADMDGVGIRESSVRRTTRAIAEQYRRSVLAPGDLLMSIRGHVGRLAFIPESLAGANITQDSARIAIVGANPTFVRGWLEGATAQHWMSRHTKGVAVRGINLGDLRRLPIPMLPTHRQIEIAADLNQIWSMRARTVRSSETASELFASLQHRALRGGL
jgi:type I restriction enzyme S subunit